ncbi:MAG: hypothetical protein DRO92_04425 [Candidatus Altiarchaeales archaeon]|nr:MAG: hypothetical protein DRO92_04425 [Candidatus Altiarchaeales archaeon]
MGTKRERELELKLRKIRAALLNMLRDANEDRKKLEEKTRELEEKSRKLSQARLATLNMLKDMAEDKKKIEEAYRELKKTQNQLIQSEKMATIGTLAGGIAHEINNPLGSILINTQMLLNDIKDEEKRESLKLIEESARRCRDIVQNLLSYSRRHELEEFMPVNLNEVIDNSYNLIRHQLRMDNINVEIKYGNISNVDGNANELQQVFTNLILNARDAIKKSGKSGTITIRTFREDKFIVSEVTDNGSGIPEEYIKRIFDPFFTTKDIGEGTGLGLSIVYKIIEKHNGKIYVSSKLGEGTTFTIKLPKSKNNKSK